MEREVKFTPDEAPSMAKFNEKFNELLKLSAPAGYGLGTVSKQLTAADDLNAVFENGWYAWSSSDSPVNAPFSPGIMHVSSYVNTAACRQTVFAATKDYKVERVRYANTWFPFEYVNPPMVLGVEYRTTERYLGKPVYVKLINFGALPNNTVKKLELEDTTIRIFEVSGVSSYGVTLGNYEGSHDARLWGRLHTISIMTASDQSAYTATVTIKYTKTTD